MSAAAGDGFTVATDVADALIARGATARAAHALAGAAVARAEREERELDARDLAALASQIGVDAIDAPLTPRASVNAKRTTGSTAPAEVAAQIASLCAELERLEGARA